MYKGVSNVANVGNSRHGSQKVFHKSKKPQYFNHPDTQNFLHQPIDNQDIIKKYKRGILKQENVLKLTTFLIKSNNCKPENALKLIQNLKDAAIDISPIVYNSAISLCGKFNNLKMAFEFFKEMRENAVNHTATTYNTLINICRKNKKYEKIEHLLKDMEKEGIKKDEYYNVP